MENKINIAELLKNCPKGMELDCLLYDNVTFISADDDKNEIYTIKVSRSDGCEIYLTKYGQYECMDDAKCVIFPKGKTTWEGFYRPFKDGDIVAGKNSACSYITIFREFINDISFSHHACLTSFGKFKVDDFSDNANLRFATEEEKQKLFDEIKARGYKWNPEIKTLEKLVEPKFKVGDKITDKSKFIYRITEITDAGYKLHDLKTTFITFEEADLYFVKVADIFDINSLIPFESKVLVRDMDTHNWIGAFYSHYNPNGKKFHIIGGSYYFQCIPYEGNEHLLGKTEDCDEYFKTW